MNSPAETRDELQQFFDGLSPVRPGAETPRAGAARAIPRALHELARSVADQLQLPDRKSGAEEMVSELLLRLLERGRDHQVAHDLRPLSPGALRAVLRHRLTQLGVEQLPGWQRTKTLRARVREAVERGLPPAPATPPSSIYEGDRIDTHALSLALASITAGSTAELTVSYLARVISNTYKIWVDDAAIEQQRSARRRVERGLEVEEVIAMVLASISDEELELLRKRFDQTRLADLARQHGLGVTTIHDWQQDIAARLREIVYAAGVSPSVFSDLIMRIGEHGAALRAVFRPRKVTGRAR